MEIKGENQVRTRALHNIRWNPEGLALEASVAGHRVHAHATTAAMRNVLERASRNGFESFHHWITICADRSCNYQYQNLGSPTDETIERQTIGQTGIGESDEVVEARYIYINASEQGIRERSGEPNQQADGDGSGRELGGAGGANERDGEAGREIRSELAGTANWWLSREPAMIVSREQAELIDFLNQQPVTFDIETLDGDSF
jgi:hypothetical protein